MALIVSEGSFDQPARRDINRQAGFLNLILAGAADVAPVFGLNLIESPGVDAITLRLPIAPVGGQTSLQAPSEDGNVLTFIDNGGHAHTVTLPSAQFQTSAGKKTVATFNGTIMSILELTARNGVWLVTFSSGVNFA